MDAAVVIALIALAGSIFSARATVFGTPVLQARRETLAVAIEVAGLEAEEVH
jgi:hypothetical protein